MVSITWLELDFTSRALGFKKVIPLVVPSVREMESWICFLGLG